MASTVITILLFNYRIADKILTQIHNNKYTTAILANISMAALMISSTAIVLTETIYILIAGSIYYPNKSITIHPNGGTRIQLKNIDNEEYRKAA